MTPLMTSRPTATWQESVRPRTALSIAASRDLVEGYDVTFGGRHLDAFGIDKTHGASAWSPPDW